MFERKEAQVFDLIMPYRVSGLRWFGHLDRMKSEEFAKNV